jgi:hypothetical protein
MNGHDLRRAFGANGQHSDVVILIQVKKIHGHRIISEVIAAFLYSGLSPRSDVLPIFICTFSHFLSCSRIRAILL